MTQEEKEWTRPLFADLTWASTREEVLAAVEEVDRRLSTLDLSMATPCRMEEPRSLSYDQVLLERQKVAGEEDQSVPGWDSAI